MKTSYDYTELPNQKSEFQLLMKRASRRLDSFIPLLQARGMENGMGFLDLACGHGIRTRAVAKNFPSSKVVGVDKSSELIEFARHSGEDLPNLKFHVEDALQLDFAKPFDVIYSRLFFQHISDPSLLLKRLRNNLRTGGKIIIEEADRDFMKFSPTPPEFREYWNSIGRAQSARGGDPYMGTKIGTLLTDAGFQKVEVELIPFVHDAVESRELIQDLLWNLNAYLEGEPRKKGEEILRQLEVCSQREDFRAFHILCVTTAEN